MPDASCGYSALAWARRWLLQPNGPLAGRAWTPTPRQARFAAWWYAVDSEGRWLFHHGVRRLAKGSGKSPFAAVLCLIELAGPCRVADLDMGNPDIMRRVVAKPVDLPLVEIAATAESQPLALDTPVPTPDGFTTIGALRVGDRVFDGNGRPVPVARATPVYVGEPCYRIVFDDRDEVVASGSHMWTVARVNSHDRKRDVVTTTTAQMAGEFLQRDGSSRYSMPPVGVEYPRVDGLAVDPYLLGLWLGDGTTKDSSIAYDTDYELDVLRLVRETLQPQDELTCVHGPGRQGLLRVRRRARLCRWGHDWTEDERPNGGGHIQCGQCLRERPRPKTPPPLPTMRERLRGIGVLGNKHIPDDYMRSHHDQRLALLQGLIDSDGTLNAKGRAMFVNRDLALLEQVRQLVVGLGFKVTVLGDPSGAQRLFFSPKDGRVVARLPYKIARHQVTTGGSSKNRYIRKIDRVENVPVRCVGIDTADHLFLVGRNNTLTHNTANTMRMVRAMASPRSAVVAAHGLDPGKHIFHKLGGGELRVITSSAVAEEGSEPSCVIEDETEHWLPGNGGTELAAVLDRNLAKSGSRALETANAWVPGVESVAESTFDAWVAQAEGRTRGDTGILCDSVVAAPDTDLADEASLMTALDRVYADCPWVDRRVIAGRIWDPRTPPDVARRFYLNQPTATFDSWATPQEWAKLVDPTVAVSDGDEIALFFDGSKSRDATALVGCRLSDGHVFAVDVWEPAEGSVVPVVEVDAAVDRAFDRWSVVAFWADVHEWESFTKVSWPERFASKLEVPAESDRSRDPQMIAWDMRGHVRDFTLAAEFCAAEIGEAAFTHDGDSRLARHVANARRRPNRYGVSIGKESRSSVRKIDAAVCVIGARMVRRAVLAARQGKKTGKKPRTGRVRGF